MTGASGRKDRRRGGRGLPVALGWALLLTALFLCCAPPSTAAQAETPAVSARTFTPVPSAVVSVVVADAPGERGIGSSCHGTTDHSKAVVLPAHPAPAALPGPSSALRAAPLTGGAVIRGPSHDGVAAVDLTCLRVRRT
ncbi:hypothetical protein AB0M10_27645 [Streptomyces sp. NPDC051840]|uniref:hypothetical protein n=1 Tax=Streptomyces sp. NPDC051840 TaxID=3154752 RepID=UPI0034255DAC